MYGENRAGVPQHPLPQFGAARATVAIGAVVLLNATPAVSLYARVLGAVACSLNAWARDLVSSEWMSLSVTRAAAQPHRRTIRSGSSIGRLLSPDG